MSHSKHRFSPIIVATFRSCLSINNREHICVTCITYSRQVLFLSVLFKETVVSVVVSGDWGLTAIATTTKSGTISPLSRRLSVCSKNRTNHIFYVCRYPYTTWNFRSFLYKQTNKGFIYWHTCRMITDCIITSTNS